MAASLGAPQKTHLLAIRWLDMWIFIAQVAIAIIIGAALLRPRSQVAPPSGLGEVKTPTAEEGRAIPVLFGTRDLNAPDIAWYGDLDTEELRTKTKSLFGSSSVASGRYRYILGMHAIFGHGPFDNVTRLYYGGRLAWAGYTTGGQIYTYKPNLFGGDNSEGGFVGYIDVEMGESDQLENDYLQSALGTNDIPAFRNLVGLVYRQVYFGTSVYIKNIGIRGKRILLAQDGAAQWYPAKAEITLDFGLDYVDSSWEYQIIAHHSDPGTTNLDVPTSGWASCTSPFGGGAVDPDDPELANTSWPIKNILWAKRTIAAVPYARVLIFNAWAENGAIIFANGTIIKEINTENVEPNPEQGEQTFSLEIKANTEVVLAVKGFDETDPGGGTYFAIRYFEHIDMNPAHIIRECLTNSAWGRGISDTEIDDVSFTAAADTLYDEGMGISLVWDATISVDEFISEIKRHIDAEFRIDIFTGLYTLKLIREETDTSNLVLLDSSNIANISDPKQSAFGELTTNVTAVFWDYSTGENGTVSVSDPALTAEQGKVISVTRQYPGFTNKAIAARAAMRDLKALSTPRWSGEIEVTRDGASVQVGDVFLVNRPDQGFDYRLMRALDVSYGDGIDNKVIISAIDDIFSTPATAIISDQETQWSDPADATALSSTPRAVIEAPYAMIVEEVGASQTDAALASNPDEGFILISGSRQGAEIEALMNVESVELGDVMSFSPSFPLLQDLGAADTTIYLNEGTDASKVNDGALAQLNEEIVQIVSIDTSSSNPTATIKRGMLDTVPARHETNSGTPDIVIWGDYRYIDLTGYTTGSDGDISVQILPRTHNDVLDTADAPTDTVSLNSRAIRPYPPGNFKINGDYFPEYVTGDIVLTWAHRDRISQGAVYYDFTTGSIGPEAGVTYNLRFYGDGDALLREETGQTGTSYTYTNAQEQIDTSGSTAYHTLINMIGVDSHWHMNDSSGSILDSVGSIDGTATDLTYEQPSLFNDGDTCVSLNGSSSKIDFGNNYNVTAAQSLTIIGWIQLSSVSTHNTIAAKRSNGYVGYVFGVTSSGYLELFVSDGSGLSVTSDTTVDDDLPHFVVAVIDRNLDEIRIYLDGAIDCTPVDITSISSLVNTRSLVFGYKSTGSATAWSWFGGYLDDMSIKYGVISASDISDLYAAGIQSGTPQLNATLRIELESERDGYVSLQKHNHTVYRDSNDL